MKHCLPALSLVLLLTSCAGVKVTHTDIATGAVNPTAIYIRPFDISDCTFIGRGQSKAERSIRKSLAPAEFSEALKEELEKLAPALVLKDGDMPATGWLVEGAIDLVDTGSPSLRAAPVASCIRRGASHISIHVRIIDMESRQGVTADAKQATGTETVAVKTGQGTVIYEFDIAGGSHGTGAFGSIMAPGLGATPMFDYRNAAERIYEALCPDEFKLGLRDSPTIR
jgi:hypothetical protein